MVKAKESGRVFYPAKPHHSRHNSDCDPCKNQRISYSPLNRSHDSTCDNSSSRSSSKGESEAKSESSKNKTRESVELVPIKLEFDDELISQALLLEVNSYSDRILYELDHDDIVRVFEKFGPVISVTIQDSSKAIVKMKNKEDFEKAEKHLHLYELSSFNAYLTVKKSKAPAVEPKSPLLAEKDKTPKTSSCVDAQTTINKIYRDDDKRVPEAVKEDQKTKPEIAVKETAVKAEVSCEDTIKVGINKD